MPWLLPAALVASSAIGAGASLLGGKKAKIPSLPAFQEDPLVGKVDSGLYDFGSNALEGNLPPAFQALMQFDSPQFEGMLHNSNRDVSSAGLETAARAGNARSGAAEAGITQAVANNSANLRYSDYLNTLTNQKSILGLGLDSEQAAGSLALNNQGQKNNYALGGYQAQLGITPSMTSIQQNGQSGTGAAIGGGISSILSSLPYISAIMNPGTTGGPTATQGSVNPGSLIGSLGTATDGSTDGTSGYNDFINKILQDTDGTSGHNDFINKILQDTDGTSGYNVFINKILQDNMSGS